MLERYKIKASFVCIPVPQRGFFNLIQLGIMSKNKNIYESKLSFKKGDIINTSDLIFPKEMYSDLFMNDEEIMFNNKDYESYTHDIAKIDFTVSVSITTP